jgi:hypothetical protein
MEMTLSKKSFDFLTDSSYKGKAWLSTQDGRSFLKKEVALQWLVTDDGGNWINSSQGKAWLAEKETVLHNLLVIPGGWKLLENETVQHWLTESEQGRHWLVTGGGYNWLHTEMGHKFLESERGKKWLDVPKELLEN